MNPINSFINLWILVILTYSTVSLVDHLIRYRSYPFKLRVIWWLIFLGLRTDKLSEEAHRIYNSHIQPSFRICLEGYNQLERELDEICSNCLKYPCLISGGKTNG